jgi:predicted lipoprotein with Yx(FWY)xxD motif
VKETLVKRIPVLGLGGAALAAGIALAGCGGGNSAAAGGGSGYASPASATTGRAAARVATVATRHTKLGTVLVDGRGRTLYLFEKDKGTASSCYGACAGVWPPLAAGGKATARGLRHAQLGTTRRRDGRTEVTVAGHPLYTYAGDRRPGDVKGQGLDQFGAEWYALAPNGHKIDRDS